jgi:hypothetical protein
MRKLVGTATITAAGFFDKSHSQGGGADKGIELHPVVSFSSTNCRTGALMQPIAGPLGRKRLACERCCRAAGGASASPAAPIQCLLAL